MPYGGLGALNITAAGPGSPAGTVVYNAAGALRSALYLDISDNAVFNLKTTALMDGVQLSASGDSYLVGHGAIGSVGIGVRTTNTPSARLHVTGGDGRILAPSGDFSKSLTVSGHSISRGDLIDGGYF